MRNFWKRFTEWATASKVNSVLGTPLRVSLTFLLVLMAIAAVFFAATFSLRREIVINSLEESGIAATNSVIDTALEILYQDLTRFAFAVYAVVVLLASIITYFLISWLFKPVRKVLEDQRRFIADASHELRTPLSILKSNTEIALMENASLTSSEFLEIAKSNLEEIDRMENILRNLLVLARVKSAGEAMQMQNISLVDVLDRAVRFARPLAAQKSVTLTIRRIDNCHLLANATALEEAVLNIVKNAIFYTPEGGQIEMWTMIEDGKSVSIMVKDTGIGIAADDLPHIFEPFFRSEHSRHYYRGVDRFGLGLAIVKEIVGHHKGGIAVDSTLGKGTQVTLSFPVLPRISSEMRMSV